MIKITIEAETPSDIKQIFDAFQNNNHNSGCKHHNGPIWRVTNVGTGEPTEYPDKTWSGSPETNSITAPDMPNVTISGSSAHKKEIPLETVKKYLNMAGTITGAFNDQEKKEVQ